MSYLSRCGLTSLIAVSLLERDMFVRWLQFAALCFAALLLPCALPLSRNPRWQMLQNARIGSVYRRNWTDVRTSTRPRPME